MKPDTIVPDWKTLVRAIADIEGLGGAARERFVDELDDCDPLMVELEERRRSLRMGATMSLFSTPALILVWHFASIPLSVPVMIVGIAMGPASYLWLRRGASRLTERSCSYNAFRVEWAYYCSSLRPHLLARHPIAKDPPALD